MITDIEFEARYNVVRKPIIATMDFPFNITTYFNTAFITIITSAGAKLESWSKPRVTKDVSPKKENIAINEISSGKILNVNIYDISAADPKISSLNITFVDPTQ